MASNKSDRSPAQNTDPDPSEDDVKCPIVAIGASAGGLEAFTQLLKHLPTDTGMAFVLIQHLNPTHASLLNQLLGKATVMPVGEVQDGMEVMPDRVYVIPPNRDLLLVGNTLKLIPRQKTHGKHMPVDRFFKSLAIYRQNRAIAVVLSGADGDGALGLAEVKAAGGITFAQDIASSKFEGMPDRAISTGCVDFILPPAEIAAEIKTISRHPYVAKIPSIQLIEPVVCSTGEEAYSLAICLLEYLAERNLKLPIQIFATDISESAIDAARTGIYKTGMMGGVSAERLRRFFVEVEGGYQIEKSVRELCVFARQNLIADPPFSQLDLISCRNVLIYLGTELQKRLIPIFHYALKPIDRYAPVGVTIDNDMNIVQFRGATGNYLEPPTGKPSFNLFKMAKPEISVELRAAVHQAKQHQEIFRQTDLHIKTIDGVKTIEIEVIPFKIGLEGRPYLLILFQESATVSADPIAPTSGSSKKGKQTAIAQNNTRLQQELTSTRAYLETIIEEQESTNQALQVANEEILSSNEKLQSTNEELETSQEELQATNEELHTINEELNIRNGELNQSNNDLQNLLSSMNIPILMLDSELRIRRFTALAQQIFNLIPSDLGRPFSNIQPNISIPDLGESIAEVIRTLSTKEQEVQDRTGNWYSLRIRPYRTSDDRVDGVTIGLVDIDTLKHSTAIVEAARDYANAIVETVRQPLLVLDANLRVMRANHCFYESFGLTAAQTEQQSIFELQEGVWDLPDLRSQLETTIDRDTEFQDFEVTQTLPSQSPRILLINARKIRDARQEHGILLAIEEITARRQAEVQIQNSLTEKEVLLREIHHRVKNNLQIVSSLLSLQSNRITDPQAISILQDSQNRVCGMATIHEILYQSPNIAELNCAKYIETLVGNLFTSHHIDSAAISLKVNVRSDTNIGVDRAVLCGLIINELVVNALKHGFGGDLHGEVAISLASVENLLTLSVGNNGRALPSDFDIRNIRSMGLNLVMSLVKQLKGDLVVATGELTLFTITFPL